MKTSYIVIVLLIAASGYVYYYHAPAAGWGSLVSECKHCSCKYSHAQQPQEVLDTAVVTDEVPQAQ